MRVSENMRMRMAIHLVILFLVSNASTLSSGSSAVGMHDFESLPGDDLGLAGAELSPSKELVIAFGQDSNVIVFSASDPSDYIETPSIGNSSLNDASFHPSGNSALIVGDNGTVLRYSDLDKSLTDAGVENLSGSDLLSVSWSLSGSWAYIGSSEGEIWRVRASGDGGAETHLLEGLAGQSPVTSIDCISEGIVCVASTTFNGIAIIQRDHSLNWIGGSSSPWSDMECLDSSNSCVAISSDILGTIKVNTSNPDKSTISGVEIIGLDGVLITLADHSENRFLISMAPFGIVEHDLEKNATFPWLENSDVVNENIQLSGERIVSTWSLNENTGWILTDRGNLASFHTIYGTVENSIVSSILSIAVLLATLGFATTVMMSIFGWGKDPSPRRVRKNSRASDSRRKR
ncbi:MAG TPA: WD40 repeat domain-containing protein [Candidatus Poseidoniales archaeon]|nr:MAG TPA: WD40 repeat domain-containing protein [Candidatus Poseidoniales archaeon]DAC40492.1 MAG TPA: WD40 repeat domain-containing protein [Candidatus Poseidoniales archaeon]